MNAEEIVRELREWNECHLSDMCIETDSQCWKFCNDGDCIAVQAADLIESMQAEVDESQCREKAAVVDLSIYKDCGFCAHLQDQQYCYKNCQRHVDVDNFRTHPCWQWRGPQEAGEGEAE